MPERGSADHRECLDPILSAQLCGTALRLAAARVPVDVAVEELRGMANGRRDLLAEPAGLMIDAASGATGVSGVPGRG
jgi:hypothetical protein